MDAAFANSLTEALDRDLQSHVRRWNAGEMDDPREKTGSAVKSVFEAASDHRLRLDHWDRALTDPVTGAEQIEVHGLVRPTGKLFRWRSAPFRNGQIEAAAAALARIIVRAEMPIVIPDFEIKGFGDAVKNARDKLAQGRASVTGVNDSADALVQVATIISKKMDNAREDLIRDATQLGNSSGGSEMLSTDGSGSGNGGA